jgi:hypothetical protein
MYWKNITIQQILFFIIATNAMILDSQENYGYIDKIVNLFNKIESWLFLCSFKSAYGFLSYIKKRIKKDHWGCRKLI